MAETAMHRLSIGGMSCAGCVSAVEKALRQVPGVTDANVNLAEHTAQVQGAVNADSLIRAVVDAGYGAAELVGSESEQDEREAKALAEYRLLLKRAAVAAVVGVPLLVGGRLGWFPPLATDNGQVLWLAAGIATFMVLLYSGRHLFGAAWRQFIHGNASQDTLIAVGIGIAWCYSMAVVFAPGTVPGSAQHAYFDTAAVLLALVNLGAVLEMRARGRMSNISGDLLCRMQRPGEGTALAHAIERVRNAQASKLSIGRFADRVAALLVYAVLIIAVLAFLAWYHFGPSPVVSYAVVAATSVLLVACPYALSLAVPIPLMIGVGKAAELGVLIRDGEALQRTGRLTTVVLGMTGTVTEGRPRVAAVVPRGWLDGDQLLEIAATVEASAEHPLAAAIVAAADEKGMRRLEVSAFETVPGRGVRAQMNQQRVVLGNSRWMDENDVKLGELVWEGERLTAEGLSPLYLALNDMGAGVIAVSDPVKADLPAAVARLHRAGLKVVMVTGDTQAVAEAAAQQAGIDAVVAEVLPGEKAALVARLQAHGEVVGMVDDGVNGMPVPAGVDVSFAVTGSADTVIGAADVTLMHDSLHGVADAVAVSRATLRNIKQNLFGAFVYNGFGIPVAAGLLYPFAGILLNPMIAGAAMTLSSLAVVTNANRLRLFRSQGMV